VLIFTKAAVQHNKTCLHCHTYICTDWD